jgi:hypothetical protein
VKCGTKLIDGFIEQYPKALVHYFSIEGEEDLSIGNLHGCNCRVIWRTDGHSEAHTTGLVEMAAQQWQLYREKGVRNISAESSPASTAAFPATNSTTSTSSPSSVYIQPSLDQHFGRLTMADLGNTTGYTYGSTAQYQYSTSSNHTPYMTYAEPVRWASSSRSYEDSYPNLRTSPIPSQTASQYIDPWGNQTKSNRDEERPIRTVYLGIIITNLSYRIRRQDLEKFLSETGLPPSKYTKLSVRTDSQGTKCAGSATVRFNTPAEAENAMILLDGREWKGRSLKVRKDKAKTPIETPSPPVVNGST